MKPTIQQTDERVRERMRHDKVVADAMGKLNGMMRKTESFITTYPETEGKDGFVTKVMICNMEIEMYKALYVLNVLREEGKNGDHR